MKIEKLIMICSECRWTLIKHECDNIDCTLFGKLQVGKVYDLLGPCDFCGMRKTIEEHDGCLGTLKGVMNACCGHGVERAAYIQWLDGSCIRGSMARERIRGLMI